MSSRYTEQMQRFIAEYQSAGERWPATSRQIARWLIRTGRWNRGENTVVQLCARDVARAMREEYHTDPQGRRVRTKHAARMYDPMSDLIQPPLWDDMRQAPREFMDRAFKGRRRQIVGDCVQLFTDLSSYNENASPENPIQLLFDFTDDVIESQQSGKLDDGSQPVSFGEPNESPPPGLTDEPPETPIRRRRVRAPLPNRGPSALRALSVRSLC